VLPSAAPLAADQLPVFRERTQEVLARLDELRTSNLALLD
jgi:hypothetical protein